MRLAISSGGMPEYCQTTETTGISIDGKMSVEVRRIDNTPISNNKIANTTNVYGLDNASLTSHIAIHVYWYQIIMMKIYFKHNGNEDDL